MLQLPQTRKEKIELLNNLHTGKIKLAQSGLRDGIALWYRYGEMFYNIRTKTTVNRGEFLEAKYKAEKVRKLSITIIIELGTDHAVSILTLPELCMTAKHLLQIVSLIPLSEVAGGWQFAKNLSKYTTIIDNKR